MKIKKMLSVLIVCTFLAASFSISVSAAIPYENMIALYNMEGALKDDVSGANGTLKNGASLISDRSGSVLYLNNDDVVSPGPMEGGYAANGQWAELAAPHIPNTDAMTISMWFKMKEVRTWARVIDMGDDRAQQLAAEDPLNGHAPGIDISISPSDGNRFVAGINFRNPNQGNDRAFGTTPELDEWVHMVVTIDGTVQAGVDPVVKLYINGKEDIYDDSLISGGNHSPKELIATTEYKLRNAFLGRSSHDGTIGDQIFNGWIDDVAIFDVALTAEQIAELSKVNFASGNPAKAVTPAVAPEATQPEAPAPTPEAAQPEAPTPTPAQTSPIPAPKTADPITLIALASIISATGAVIAKKRK